MTRNHLVGISIYLVDRKKENNTSIFIFIMETPIFVAKAIEQGIYNPKTRLWRVASVAQAQQLRTILEHFEEVWIAQQPYALQYALGHIVSTWGTGSNIIVEFHQQ